MCQGCVADGMISQSVYDACEAFLDSFPSAEFGPAHIVLGDDNVKDSHIQWCLENFELYSEGHSQEELEATKTFLVGLLAIPEEERVPNLGKSTMGV